MTTAGLDALLRNVRYEVIPARGTEQAVADFVPAGMTVTVTASPVRGLEPTVELAERLAARGYRVVPHLAARSVTGDTHLAEIVARLTACGVDDVFVAGGDAPTRRPVRRRAGAARAAGRDGPPVQPDRDHRLPGEPPQDPRRRHDPGHEGQARYASYIVSNVLRRSRADPLDRPDQGPRNHPAAAGGAGHPGRARPAAADGGGGRRVGVGPVHHQVSRLDPADWAPGGYSPDRLLDRAAAALTGPGSGVAGLHLFTLNQLQQAEQWRRAALRRTGSDTTLAGIG